MIIMKRHHLIYALIGLFSLNGCSSDLLIENPPDILVPDNLYRDKAGFQAGVYGLYDEVRRSRAGNTYGSSNGLMLQLAYIGVDNAYANWRSPTEDPFNEWGAKNNSTEDQYRRVWGWLYETINAANTIINRSENEGIDWTEEEKNGILAETRAIRAWAYRHLTYLWGDVPLTLEESSGSTIKTDWQRTPIADVQKAMEEDWLFAEAHLPVNPAQTGGITKGAVQHYLAELYLAMGEPGKARDMALKVVENPEYRLVTERYGVKSGEPGTPFTDMFIDGNVNRSQGNTEALWVLQNELNVIGGEGYNIMARYWINRYYSLRVGGKNPIMVTGENGGRGIGRLGPTKYAISLYEEGDDRGSGHAWRLYWIINNPSGVPDGYQLGDTIYLDTVSIEKLSNPDWPHIRKWDHNHPIDPSSSTQYDDQALIRSGETWLLLAEAYLKLNEPGLAAQAINTLRQRANASPVTENEVTMDFILDERSRELFSEEERRYTLLRTGTWLERTKLYNHIAGPNVTPRDALFPIPQDVIDANINAPMDQNDGY